MGKDVVEIRLKRNTGSRASLEINLIFFGCTPSFLVYSILPLIPPAWFSALCFMSQSLKL